MMPVNCYPGEEGRVARAAAGEDPPRSREFKTIQIHATGEARLGHPMLQTSAKTPLLDPSHMVPNGARFLASKADRSCGGPEATVADRLGWAKLSTKTHKAGHMHCTQLTLPFFVTAMKLEEVQDPTSGWSRQSHGTSVNALQSVLEGHQMLPSNTRYGESITQGMWACTLPLALMIPLRTLFIMLQRRHLGMASG
eukprot:2501561-Pyramimonas_sp.AAC.1